MHLNLLPQESDFIDTISNKHFYTPFPEKLQAAVSRAAKITEIYKFQILATLALLSQPEKRDKQTNKF